MLTGSPTIRSATGGYLRTPDAGDRTDKPDKDAPARLPPEAPPGGGWIVVRVD